jgi:hypothetical protein
VIINAYISSPIFFSFLLLVVRKGRGAKAGRERAAAVMTCTVAPAGAGGAGPRQGAVRQNRDPARETADNKEKGLGE